MEGKEEKISPLSVRKHFTKKISKTQIARTSIYFNAMKAFQSHESLNLLMVVVERIEVGEVKDHSLNSSNSFEKLAVDEN